MKKFLLLFVMVAFFGIATQAQTAAPKNSDKKEVTIKEQAPVTEKKSENAAEHKHDAKGACCASKTDKAEGKAAGCGSGASASAAPKSCCASKASASAAAEGEKAETKRSRKNKK